MARTRDPTGRPARAADRLLDDRGTWILTAEVWAVIGAVTAGVEGASMGIGPAGVRVVEAVLWWLLTLLATGLSDAVPVRGAEGYRALAVHLLAVAAAGALMATAVQAASSLLAPGWRDRAHFASTVPTTALVYVAAAGVAHAGVFWRERGIHDLAAERSASLAAEAQLHALKMELQPHFLFNTLNAIAALMHRNLGAANEMLVLLADMLRSSLSAVHEQQVELRKEVETLRTYVRIQEIRLGARLEVVWEVDPDALRSRVPHLILQPLVENAIVHGIEGRASGGWVRIGAHRNGARLELLVRDNGVGASAAGHGFGLGLANTRARLVHLYGEEQRFAILDAPDGGTIAFVSIPSPTDAPDDRAADAPAAPRPAER